MGSLKEGPSSVNLIGRSRRAFDGIASFFLEKDMQKKELLCSFVSSLFWENLLRLNCNSFVLNNMDCTREPTSPLKESKLKKKKKG